MKLGMLTKALLYGAAAGTLAISAWAVPMALEWRDVLAGRTPAVSLARDVAAGQTLGAQDLATVPVAEALEEGSVVWLRADAEGRVLQCPGRKGALLVKGCLRRDEPESAAAPTAAAP